MISIPKHFTTFLLRYAEYLKNHGFCIFKIQAVSSRSRFPSLPNNSSSYKMASSSSTGCPKKNLTNVKNQLKNGKELFDSWLFYSRTSIINFVVVVIMLKRTSILLNNSTDSCLAVFSFVIYHFRRNAFYRGGTSSFQLC